MSAIEVQRRVIPSESAASPFQRRLALIVVTLPALGTLAAIGFAVQRHHVNRVTLVCLGVMYLVTGVGIEVGFHRYFSHRAFTAGRTVRVALAVAGSMAAQGPLLFWAAVHRRHHAFTDVPGDPHSPYFRGERPLGVLEGLWHAHAGWLFREQLVDFSKYTPDLLRDPSLFGINRSYLWWTGAGILLPGIVGCVWTATLWGGIEGLLWGGFVRTFIGHHSTWSVNSFGHMFGSQPHHGRGRSKNNPVLSIMSFGGSWHNNHHAFPSAATTARRWWQIDLGGLFIRLLAALRLANDVKGSGIGPRPPSAAHRA